MKKIFFSIVAIAALAACSKSEVAYEQPAEIGFKAVAGNMTKTAVSGEEYPKELDMYVYAWTTDFAPADDNYYPNYIDNGLFVCKDKTFEKYTEKDDKTDRNPIVWGGQTPYYWPNTKSLHFAGYSASGNVANLSPTYDCRSNVLSITGYTPGTDDNNDLMVFPSTATATPTGYDKNTDYVPVYMYHTCAWISFLVKGDGVTGAQGSNYAVTNITITDIDATADLTYNGTTIVWNNNTDNDATSAVLSSSVSLSGTGANAAVAETTPNSTILIPQVPGKLSLTYTYTSQAQEPIIETITGLDLALDEKVVDTDTGDTVTKTPWEAGKHYIYTITIKANEILIAPSVAVDWTDGNFNVTVE